jgi:hypothetical protein
MLGGPMTKFVVAAAGRFCRIVPSTPFTGGAMRKLKRTKKGLSTFSFASWELWMTSPPPALTQLRHTVAISGCWVISSLARWHQLSCSGM